ncbi:MAG: hypothetical protein VKS61_13650 [Candidatus Sericytochromatia bacterium]|nr:hypothetical protein [Candidatus Sericytochromatia bacterium]
MRVLAFVLAASTLLAACGSSPAVGTLSPAERLAAQANRKKAVKTALDQASYEAGLAFGKAKASGKASRTQLKQGVPDQYSFACGYALGLMLGALASYDRLDASFNAEQYRGFADIQWRAMKDAHTAIKNNPELAQKAAVVLGMLEGGMRNYGSIQGSFNASQWKTFADANRNVLEAAAEALHELTK